VAYKLDILYNLYMGYRPNSLDNLYIRIGPVVVSTGQTTTPLTPTTVSMPPRIPRSVPIRKATHVDLALDDLPPARYRYVAVSGLSKELFDQAQSFLSVQRGRRLTQLETFELILADAIERGCLAAMPSPS
jgi:hypothetical protein